MIIWPVNYLEKKPTPLQASQIASRAVRDAEIVQEFRAGKKSTELAIQFDLSQTRIEQILIKQKARQRKQYRMNREMRNSIIAFRKEGFTYAEIGQKTGYSKEYIWQIIEKEKRRLQYLARQGGARQGE